jgi:SAM-dependent methyltransferase
MSFKQVESRKLELINRSVPSCDSILDLGAGDGAYLPFLAHKVGRVVAIEINRDLCGLIKADGFEAVLADARFIPFKDDAFGSVWASEIVEHTPSFNMIEEIERVTRKTIIITMPNPWSPHYKRDETHVLKYSLFSLSSYLKARRKNSNWSYKLRGLGFYWVPLPGFAKKLTAYITYYLPWFSPTVYIVGVRFKGHI